MITFKPNNVRKDDYKSVQGPSDYSQVTHLKIIQLFIVFALKFEGLFVCISLGIVR